MNTIQTLITDHIDIWTAADTEKKSGRGRAALVLPDGFLFGEGIKTRIKEKLLDECNLHTIVRLPCRLTSPHCVTS
jgi:type I restriction enzyme M protein